MKAESAFFFVQGQQIKPQDNMWNLLKVKQRNQSDIFDVLALLLLKLIKFYKWFWCFY